MGLTGRGDELLTSTMEYPNCIATMRRVAGRYGVKIRQFGVPIGHRGTADEVVASIRRQIRPGQTKALFFSCPIQPTGIMMPARRIAQLAQQHGIITVVDGAHFGGQFVPRLDELGIDFWGISGHKWQCGPGGTGILYARNRLHSANSAPLPKFFKSAAATSMARAMVPGRQILTSGPPSVCTDFPNPLAGEHSARSASDGMHLAVNALSSTSWRWENTPAGE